ncbi:hypothetical protein AVEN_77176-1 [Araneus ventricosus]|uniref:Uncharacterized protein n=1 Tax=Araneus ventricosus TaxID=182803 RepID=A0A4Y2PF62_ARAVE|nr:hypothetical protein AVEN_77176-1 [Araneus ventricosus]
MSKTHPCLVKIKNCHNQIVNSAATLKYRDLCPEIRQNFVDLFRRGHNAASALKCHKTDLMIEKGDYDQAAADGMLMLSYSVVFKLFEKEFSRTYGSISGDGMI